MRRYIPNATHSPVIKITHFHPPEFSRTLIVGLIVSLLSACNPKEDTLAEREARISARESELVTLFSELVDLRKSLEKQKTETATALTEPSNSRTSGSFVCDDQSMSKSASPQTIAPSDDKTVLGALEHVVLDPPGAEFSARIDSGARTSSVNALNIVEFERDGKPFVKFSIAHPHTGELIEVTRRLRRHVKIKERGDRDAQRRPVVRMRVTIANISEQIDFTLENRSKFKHQVLIGRNLLNDLAVVDVSKKYTKTKTDTTGSNSDH